MMCAGVCVCVRDEVSKLRLVSLPKVCGVVVVVAAVVVAAAVGAVVARNTFCVGYFCGR